MLPGLQPGSLYGSGQGATVEQEYEALTRHLQGYAESIIDQAARPSRLRTANSGALDVMIDATPDAAYVGTSNYTGAAARHVRALWVGFGIWLHMPLADAGGRRPIDILSDRIPTSRRWPAPEN